MKEEQEPEVTPFTKPGAIFDSRAVDGPEVPPEAVAAVIPPEMMSLLGEMHGYAGAAYASSDPPYTARKD